MRLYFEDRECLWQIRNSILLSLDDFRNPVVSGKLVLLLVGSVPVSDVESFSVGRDVSWLVFKSPVLLLTIDDLRLAQISTAFLSIV